MALVLQNIFMQTAEGICLNIKELRFQGAVTYAIAGPRGAGKNALLRIAGLLDRPDRGEIFWIGDTTRINKPLKDRVSFVSSKPYLFNTTVRENIAWGLPRNIGPRLLKNRVDGALEITGLIHLAKKPVHFLSAGETRRVALARAVAGSAEIILIDEPTQGLDSLSALQMENSLKKLHSRGIGLVAATGDLVQASRIAQKVLYLQNGQVMEIPPARSDHKFAAKRQVI